MKTRNFPARKLARQIAADIKQPSRIVLNSDRYMQELDMARNVRTKKYRASR